MKRSNESIYSYGKTPFMIVRLNFSSESKWRRVCIKFLIPAFFKFWQRDDSDALIKLHESMEFKPSIAERYQTFARGRNTRCFVFSVHFRHVL